MTKYMERLFEKTFRHGLELWTSEDGMMTGIATLRCENSDLIVTNNFGHRRPVLASKHAGFMSYETNPEYWNGSFAGRNRKVWMQSVTETEYPVFVYDLERMI